MSLICRKCGINLLGPRKRCPLCSSMLTGTVLQESVFPEMQLGQVPDWFALRLSVYITVVAAVVCVTINASTTPDKWWSLFVLAGLCSLWCTVGIAFYKRRNVLKLILWQVIILIALSILWDLLTGFHRWSINFAIPIICTLALIGVTIIARVLRRDIRDYMIYLVIDIVLGVSTFILILCGLLTVVLPAYICLGISILILSALIVFQGKTLWSELRRRMHV